jgi:hypothetical protein
MPFITVKIVPPARLVAKRFERLRRKIPLISLQRLYDAAVAIRHVMKEPGKPISHPVHWDSPRQRKAFFATDGFRRGIPTRRTDEYIRAWQVIKIEHGYDVGNPLAHARYIGGTPKSIRRQSRIHRGRWNLLKTTIDRVVGKLPRKVRESLKITARREGFRTKD